MDWVFVGILILSGIQMLGSVVYLGLGPLNLNFTYKYLTPSNVPQYTTTNDFVNEMQRYGIEWVFELTVMFDNYLPWAVMTVYTLNIRNSMKGLGLLYLYIIIDFIIQLKWIWRLIVFFDCTQFGQICRNPNPLGDTRNTSGSFNDNQTWKTVFWYNFIMIFWLFIWLSVIYYIPKATEKEQLQLVDELLSKKGYSRRTIDVVLSRLKETEEDIGSTNTNTKDNPHSLNVDSPKQFFTLPKTSPINNNLTTSSTKIEQKYKNNLEKRGGKLKKG